MRNPLLYKIGMEYRCYGKLEFIKWIFYALWHGLVTYFICFWAITVVTPNYNHSGQSDGKELGFWIAGHCVYAVCIFISNLTLWHKFHNHDIFGSLLFLLMIVAFPFIFGI